MHLNNYSKKSAVIKLTFLVLLCPSVGSSYYPFSSLMEDCKTGIKIEIARKENANSFFNFSKDELMQYGVCMGYLNGMVDHEKLYNIARKNTKMYCLPEKYDYYQLIHLLLANKKRIDIDKEFIEQNAAWAVNEILFQNFPCEKGK